MNKAKVMRMVLNALIIIVSCILLFCVYKLYTIWQGYNSNQKTQSQVQDLFYGQNVGETQTVFGEESQKPEIEENIVNALDPVIAANEDTVGWI